MVQLLHGDAVLPQFYRFWIGKINHVRDKFHSSEEERDKY